MEFTPTRNRFTWEEAEVPLNRFNHDLQMYKNSPDENITFEEFQSIAIERLKVLHLVEHIGSQCLSSPQECLSNLRKCVRQKGFYQFARLFNGKGCDSQTEQDFEARRRDCYSHFALRLAFGLSETLYAWFVLQETELFRWRFTALNTNGIANLMKMYNMNLTPISMTEKNEIFDDLSNSSIKEIDVNRTDFYKLPFEEILDLVRDRKVFINKGMAYLPHTEMISVFVSMFKQHLTCELENIPLYITNFKDDERLMQFFKSLPESYNVMSKVIWSTEHTPINMLDELSKTSYPLCMRIMHEQLIANKHLKNGGRVTYGLFLKGIGVTLEDALVFWKNIFLKGKERDKFDKIHRYTFRHLYGQEGRKCNYTPYSCTKIINATVGRGEYHSCPFRYMDNNSLKSKLIEYKLSPSAVNDITDLAKKGEFLNACQKYFEATHSRPLASISVHPNAYYLESRAIHNGTTDSQSQTQTQSQDSSVSQVNTENGHSFSPSVTPNIERRFDYKSPATKTTPLRTPAAKKKLDIETMLNEDTDDEDWGA